MIFSQFRLFSYFSAPSIVGSVIENCGTKVTSINPMNIAAYIGIMALPTRSIGSFAMPQPTKSAEPTGGVQRPMARL